MEPYYEQDGITIYHGDCREVLPMVHEATCLLTDPPYTAAGGSSNGRSSELDYQFFEHWLRDIGKLTKQALTQDACGLWFCDWRTLSVLTRALRDEGEWQRSPGWFVSQSLVWDREHIGMGSPFRNQFEMLAFWRGPDFKSQMPKNIGTVIRHRWPYGRHEFHPAEKPVKLCRQLLEWMPGTVLDPFMGSGTTLRAAKDLARNAIGIECDERLCEVAAGRLAQQVLFT